MRHRNPISQVRGLFYGAARALGWVAIVMDLLSGHGKKAGKRLMNKAIGRKLGSKIYFR